MKSKLRSSPIILLGVIFLTVACKKSGDNDPGEETGYLTGRVTDTQSQPLANVKVLADNSIIFNSNIQTSTDAQGRYKMKLQTGAWIAYAILTRTYHGKTYTLYLDPETDEGFGIEGGVRNFQWKLTGSRKGSLTGTYGGTVLLTRAVGSTLFDSENIEYTLTPSGNLIDGTAGETLTIRESTEFPKLADVPIGRYVITAVYKGTTGNTPLKLKNRYVQNGDFSSSIVVDFEPSSPDGDNIASIEYREN